MTPDKTVEAVARAICLEAIIQPSNAIMTEEERASFASTVDAEWKLCLPEARAAIKAHTECLMEPSEEVLKRVLDAKYCRNSKRSKRVKDQFPEGYAGWLINGLKVDAPEIVKDFQAMLLAQEKT